MVRFHAVVSLLPCLRRGMDTSNCIKPPFRSVKVHSPYSWKQDPLQVEQQLQRLEDEGIIYKVS